MPKDATFKTNTGTGARAIQDVTADAPNLQVTRTALTRPDTTRVPLGETNQVGVRNANATAFLQAREKGGIGRRQKTMKTDKVNPNRLMMGSFTAATTDLKIDIAAFKAGGEIS